MQRRNKINKCSLGKKVRPEKKITDKGQILFAQKTLATGVKTLNILKQNKSTLEQKNGLPKKKGAKREHEK